MLEQTEIWTAIVSEGHHLAIENDAMGGQARREAAQFREAIRRVDAARRVETRDALRQTYPHLLVAQRRSREASLQLADAGGADRDGTLAEAAIAAHAAFIDHDHQLNLDSSRPMWLEARGLRDVLDHMLQKAQAGNDAECKALVDLARDARQKLEISFRVRLGYQGQVRV